MTTLRPHSHLDDASLLTFAAEGDQEAFAAIYDRHHDAAYAAARRVLPPHAAEDVAQEALMALWGSAERFSPQRGTVRALVVVMARSRAIDQLRRDRARRSALERAEREEQRAAEGRTEAIAIHRECAGDVSAALGRLPAEQDNVVRLVYLAGHTHAEAADHLGIPLGTAKGRSRLAFAKLREDLAQYAPAA